MPYAGGQTLTIAFNNKLRHVFIIGNKKEGLPSANEKKSFAIKLTAAVISGEASQNSPADTQWCS